MSTEHVDAIDRLDPPARSAEGADRRTRVVDRLVIHGDPIDFRELCRRAVPRDARYLILDLDRTLHLGRNMGELFGWELCAREAYGAARLDELEPRRRPGRFFLDWRRPAALAHYLLVGARVWLLPGLFYLLFGKLAGHVALLRRWCYRVLGPDPVAAAQRVPQTALLRHMAGRPSAELRALARRVWERHRADQVIEREDLAWLRQRCPKLRVVLASASPAPMLAAAAEALGVDDVICTRVEEHDGRPAYPYHVPPPRRARAMPARVSPPSRTHINSSRAKIAALHARFPDLADPGVVSVGMSDTDHGEDHCWAEHLTCVVDVNSGAPFPPIVPAASPLREIHSAAVLTWRERQGDGFRDPRRRALAAAPRAWSRRELAAALSQCAELAEVLARRADDAAAAVAAAGRAVRDQLDAATARVERLVRAFNEAAGRERERVARELRREIARSGRLRRALVRVERPVAALRCAVDGVLADSRARLADRAGW